MRKVILLLIVLCGLAICDCYARKPKNVEDNNPPCYVENEDENYYYGMGSAESRNQRQSQIMAIHNAQNELMSKLGIKSGIIPECEIMCTKFGYTANNTIITYVSIRVLKRAIASDLEYNKTDTSVIR